MDKMKIKKADFGKLEKTTFDMIKGTQIMLRDTLPPVQEEIDNMIKSKEKSPRKIEFYLDTLLDWMILGIGEKEFKKLNEYYSTFDKENANHYQNYYKEMMEE